MMQEATKIGENLKLLRENAGLSRRDIGHYLGVSVQQIHKYESGVNRLPVDKLFYLRHLFDRPYEHFFTGLADPDATLTGRDTLAWKIYLDIAALENESLRGKIRDVVEILTK